MDIREIFKPLRALYVPSGWQVSKNHLFDINKEGFISIKDENQQFLVREFFVNDTIFYAKHEHPLSTSQLIVGTLYMGCKILDFEKFILEYDITLHITLANKKKKKEITCIEKTAKTAQEAAEKLSNMMELFSHEKIVDFNNGQPIKSMRSPISRL